MLWRLKWRLTGVIADFTHVVLYDEGHDQPDPFRLLLYVGVLWALAWGTLAAAAAMDPGLLAVPAVIAAGLMAIMATVATVGSGWFLFEWYHRPNLFSGRAEP